jgi:GNAT superfamily N-acetyltransferase
MYGFVRGRQLDGTYPGEPATGVWPITGLRVGFGWGMLPEEAWPKGGDWPPVEPPNVDTLAKRLRMGRYQRVRSLDECRAVMAGERPLPVLASVDITDGWANAPNGVVPACSPDDVFIGSHCVLLVGFDDARAQFTFQNSWGATWGKNGFGYIGYETLDATLCEGWISDVIGGRDDSPKQPAGFKRGAWGLAEHGGGMFHCREFVDPSDERIGWMFAIERTEAIEVEELFVRPAFRRRGYGTRLARLARELASTKGLPLRIWISHADVAPSNLEVVEKLMDPLNLQIADSSVRWAPLVANPESRCQGTHSAPTPGSAEGVRRNPPPFQEPTARRPPIA